LSATNSRPPPSLWSSRPRPENPARRRENLGSNWPNSSRGDAACAAEVKKFPPTYKYDELLAKYNEDKAKYDEAMKVWRPLAEAAKKDGKPAPSGPPAPRPVGKAGEANSGKIGELFERYVRPYVGYGIKGVLWDQGESKTNIALVDQYTLMGALIKGWRKDWDQGFLFSISRSRAAAAPRGIIRIR